MYTWKHEAEIIKTTCDKDNLYFWKAIRQMRMKTADPSSETKGRSSEVYNVRKKSHNQPVKDLFARI